MNADVSHASGLSVAAEVSILPAYCSMSSKAVTLEIDMCVNNVGVICMWELTICM